FQASKLESHHFEEFEYQSNLVLTDKHDLHIDAIFAVRTSWLRSVARRLLEKGKYLGDPREELRRYFNILANLLEDAEALAFKVAVFRVISLETQGSWSFDKVSPARWANEKEPLGKYKSALSQESGKSEIDFEFAFD